MRNDGRSTEVTNRSLGENHEMPIIKFSLIVLTYNRKGLLQKCIRSALNQNYQKQYEIVVVDDCSTDSTKDIIGVLRETHKNIVYIRHEKNLGVGAARNTGSRHAKGEFIAFLADDYILPKDYLLKVEAFFNEYANAEVMACRLKCLNDNYWELVQFFVYDTIYTQLIFFSPLSFFRTFKYVFVRLPPLKTVQSSYYLPPRPAAVFRRDLLARFQFADTLRSNEDADLSIRLRNAGIPVYLNSDIRIQANFGERVKDHIMKEYAHGRDSLIYIPGNKTPARAVAQFLGGIIDALIVVRQTRDIKEYIALFPGVLCVITAFRSGYLEASIRRFFGPERDHY